MKNVLKAFGIIALLVIIGFSMACGGGGGGGDPDLSGKITISPTTATVCTELTATYSGSETVSYQWKNSTANVGTNSNKYTPSEAGNYTVTITAAGFKSKQSNVVTVTVPFWTEVMRGDSSSQIIKSIAYGNNMFVAVGRSNYKGIMATSPDA